MEAQLSLGGLPRRLWVPVNYIAMKTRATTAQVVPEATFSLPQSRWSRPVLNVVEVVRAAGTVVSSATLGGFSGVALVLRAARAVVAFVAPCVSLVDAVLVGFSGATPLLICSATLSPSVGRAQPFGLALPMRRLELR